MLLSALGAENMATYIYQRDGWSQFHWKQDELADQLAAVSRHQGRLTPGWKRSGYSCGLKQC